MTPHNSFEFCIFYSLQRRFAINFCATRCADSTTSHQSCRFATMPVVCFMQMLKCLGPFPRNTLLTWQDAAEQHNRQGMSIFPQDRMIPGTSKLNLRWLVKKKRISAVSREKVKKEKTLLQMVGWAFDLSTNWTKMSSSSVIWEKRKYVFIDGEIFQGYRRFNGGTSAFVLLPSDGKKVLDWMLVHIVEFSNGNIYFCFPKNFFFLLPCKCYCSCFEAASQ